MEEGNKHQVAHKVKVQVYFQQLKQYFYLTLQCLLVSDVQRIMFQMLIVRCRAVLPLCGNIQIGPRLKFPFQMSGCNQDLDDVLKYIPRNSAGG